jgi:hypothetical protein
VRPEGLAGPVIAWLAGGASAVLENQSSLLILTFYR